MINSRAFETQSGNQLWQTNLGTDVPRTGITVPAAASEHVLLGAKERILAFGREDGAKEWERVIEGFPLGPITIDRNYRLGILPVERAKNDSVVGELITFEIPSGEQRWTAPLRVSPYTVPPAIFTEQVFGVGYDEAETPVIRAFSLGDGQLRWEQELSGPETPPVVTDSGVFIGDSGTLYQFTHSGERKNEVTCTENNAAFRAIAVAEETAFVLSDNGLTAVSVPDGNRQWHCNATAQADGLCVGKDGIVAPVSSDEFNLDTSWPCIAAFSRSDGTVRWYHAVDDAFDPVISVPPVIADGAVFVMSNTRSGVTALGDLPPQEQG